MENGMQKELNDALITAAVEGRTEAVLSLLEKGAEVDCGNDYRSTPLMCAACHGRLEVVMVLLEAGADISLRNSLNNTAEMYASQNKFYEIEKILQNPPSKQTVDEVIFQRPLSNRTLEEVFNFVSLERISLIRNGKHGPVEAVVRESFSAIEDESALRKAFEEHIRRGGMADESAVFPNKLLKNKLPRPE